MTEYLKTVTDKEGELSDLYFRMDADKELVNLTKYIMQDVKGKQVPDIVNVTLNKPAVFTANVESALNNAVEQVSIISEDKKTDKDHIADCVRAGFASANTRLRIQGRFPLNPFIDQQMCRRGRGSARCLFQFINGEMVANIIPWDTRYVAYDVGENGLSWASYRTTRSKSDIEKDYPTANVTGKTAEVVDYWDTQVNAVYVEGNLILEQPHSFGYTPVCVQVVTLGSMLADAGVLKYQGESIFFLIRDCIPELNRVISMMQTLNMLAIKPPKGWASKDSQQEAPEYNELMKAGSVTPHETGGGPTNIDFGDLKNATIYAMNILDNAIKQGSLDIIDVGTLPGPMSAVALIQIGEGRDQVFLPRLAARGLLNQQIADMFLNQIVNSGQSKVLLGTKGRQRIYDVKKLQGEYEVEFNYFVKSPKIDIARYSMAQVAKQIGLPQEDIDRDVLQLEDPEGVARRRDWEMAEKLSHLVLTRRIIKSLSDMNDPDASIDAELLAMDMGVQVDQVLSGNMTSLKQPVQPAAPQQNNLLPLLAQPNSAKQAANLQNTPQGGQ